METKINYGELIEKYRWLIGGFLVLILAASIGILVYKENFQKQDNSEKIAALENRISDLENRIDQLSKTKPTAVVAESQNQASPPAVAGASTESSVKITGKININTATAAELDTLPGIGTAYANRIIEYRNANGGFKKIDDIMKVKGIGEKTFEKLRDKITV